jgi:glycosyltransferase involved in cell wall biosynthesis
VIVPEADSGALAAAIQRLIDDPSLRARLGAAARQRAVVELSWERCVDGLLAAYSLALAGRSRAVSAR